MYKQNIFVKGLILTFVIMTFLLPNQIIYASTSDVSAKLTRPSAPEKKGVDRRAKILAQYLRLHNSPLSAYADLFIREADKNNLDWELLPSIAGVESTFGKYLPAESYNGWGFGIYGNHVIRFSSWGEAISTIAAALRHDYREKYGARSVEQIGYIYAADRSWSYKVRHFMAEIDSLDDQTSDVSSLPISL